MSCEWRKVLLADLIEIKHGFAFKGQYFRDEPTLDICLTPGNFAIGGGFKSDKLKFYDGPVDEEYVLAKDDLIVTMTDLSKEADTLGYPALVPESCTTRYLHNQRLGKVEIKHPDSISKGFLYYLMCGRDYRNEIVAGATGTTVKHTSPTKIRSVIALIPPLPEQKAIAYILGTLDDKIELNRRMNHTLEEMARAIFKSWFVDFDPVRAKMDGKKPAGMDEQTAALFPDGFEHRDGELIPTGWKQLPMPDATTFREGPGILAKDFHEEGVPLIRLAGLKNGVSLLEGCDFLDPTKVKRKWEHFRLIKGDILLSTSASLGRVAEVGDEAVGAVPYTGIISFRSKESISAQRYILHYLASSHFQIQVEATGAGSVLRHFGPTHLKRMHVLVPHVEVQRRFSELVSPLDEAQARGLQESATLAAFRDTLLPKLLSGEIRVGEAEKAVEEVA